MLTTTYLYTSRFAPNERPCRRHAWHEGRCILCGAGDEHRWCIQDWHRCWDDGGKGYGW